MHTLPTRGQMYTLIPEEKETTRLPNSYKILLQELATRLARRQDSPEDCPNASMVLVRAQVHLPHVSLERGLLGKVGLDARVWLDCLVLFTPQVIPPRPSLTNQFR